MDAAARREGAPFFTAVLAAMFAHMAQQVFCNCGYRKSDIAFGGPAQRMIRTEAGVRNPTNRLRRS